MVSGSSLVVFPQASDLNYIFSLFVSHQYGTLDRGLRKRLLAAGIRIPSENETGLFHWLGDCVTMALLSGTDSQKRVQDRRNFRGEKKEKKEIHDRKQTFRNQR